MRIDCLILALSTFILGPSAFAAPAAYLVKDIYPGAAGSPYPPSQLTPAGPRIFFTAYQEETGKELWVSDGTSSGTHLVMDIRPGPGNSDPQLIAAVDDVLIFDVWDGLNPRCLWRSDGTATGTYKIGDVTFNGSLDTEVCAVGGVLCFAGTTPDHGAEPWRTDGTPAGTSMIADLRAGTLGSSPENMIEMDGSLYFTGWTSSTAYRLRRTNASMEAITPIKAVGQPSRMMKCGGRLFFDAISGSYWKLFTSDGTDTGTLLVSDAARSPSNLVDMGGILMFAATDNTNGKELWRSDGTAAGTYLVRDIRPGAWDSSIKGMVSLGGQVFFWANDGKGSGSELWVSDGTFAGTRLFVDLKPGLASSTSGRVFLHNSRFYFTLQGNPDSLWICDGTPDGTQWIASIYSYTGEVVPVEGLVFYLKDDAATGRELWATPIELYGNQSGASFWRGYN